MSIDTLLNPQSEKEHVHVPDRKKSKKAQDMEQQGLKEHDHQPSRLGESGTNKRKKGSQHSAAGEGVSSSEKSGKTKKLNPVLARAHAGHNRRENGLADPRGGY